MRVVVYILILASLFFVPLQSAEIANLEPIQAVWLQADGETVLVITDTNDEGSGATVADALAKLKANSSRIIYLDTAQYLLLSASAVDKVPALEPYLKNTIRLYLWDGHGDFAEAVKYADAHKLGVTLKQWRSGVEIPRIPLVKKAGK